MTSKLESNARYAEELKRILGLRREPVAVKLVREEEDYPEGYVVPEGQLSHCQAVSRASKGECLKVPFESHNCHVGSAVLGMVQAPEKIISGEFHASIGIHDGPEAAARMIADRLVIPYKTKGEIICPLAKVSFDPDVVVFEDMPERIYWFVALMTAEKGNRAEFSTAPFQCVCEDSTTIPIMTGRPNISLGCYGCRKRTDMRPDEMAIGVPYDMIPGFVERLAKYEEGVFKKAKRD